MFGMNGKPRRIWDKGGPPEQFLCGWSEENDSPASRVGDAQGLLTICKPQKRGQRRETFRCLCKGQPQLVPAARRGVWGNCGEILSRGTV
jgi:hypothetical protein